MINILVVDDEPISADGIAIYLAEHGETDWNVITAYGGMSALASIHMRIDILISDIMMPVIDGFALHQRMIQHWPRMKTIFLTGYPLLDNAQKAIRADNVIDYILKTEDEQAVLQAVRKAVTAFNADMRAQDIIRKAKEDIKKARPLLQKELLSSLLLQKLELDEPLQERFFQLELPLQAERPVLLLLVQFGSLLQRENGHDLMNFALENIMEKYLWPAYRFFAIAMDSRRVVYFLQWQSGETADQVMQVFSLLEGVQQTYSRTIGALSMVLDCAYGPWSQVGQRYLGLIHTMERNASVLNEGVTLQSSEWELTEVAPHASLLELRGLLESKAYERAAKYLQEMEQPQTYRGRIDLYRRLLKLYCLTMDARDEEEASYPNNKLPPLVLDPEGWQQVIHAFALLFASMSRSSTYAVQSNNQMIEQTKAYVREHLSEDLSLTVMADWLGRSTSNLSRVFKQVTGMGYNEYIVQQRMHFAAQLLRQQSRLRLNDVASAVGYATPSYFIRVFREHFGMTPTEYKKTNGA